MKKHFLIVAFVLALALVLAACGGGGASDDPAAAGEKLFAEQIIGAQPGCITCHSLDADTVIVGPSLAGIGSRSDADTLRESILDPNAVLVEGFPSDTMPPVWSDELTDEQVDQLVAYLLTLK
ncbi:MAG: cytochrome c [Anaerolineae bacterium]|nr:cytochrome c [Anaerolineae bacterium]MBL6965265.1 cytochrome c [Anaerolineales bacterium]